MIPGRSGKQHARTKSYFAAATEDDVMFSVQEVVDAIKTAAFDTPKTQTLTYCQALEAKSKQIGFESFHDLRAWLTSTPDELIGDYSLSLMRKLCAQRLPMQSCPYYEFMSFPDETIGFYSYWIGWDREAREVRVPRPLRGKETASRLRKISEHPIYTIESSKELSAWLWSWRRTALIPEDLARSRFPECFNKDHLVDKNPPLHKVARKMHSEIASRVES